MNLPYFDRGTLSDGRTHSAVTVVDPTDFVRDPEIPRRC
jgi:hypothetical protein